jgi:hypothetical protein
MREACMSEHETAMAGTASNAAMVSAISCMRAILDGAAPLAAVGEMPLDHLAALADFALSTLLAGAWAEAQLTSQQWALAQGDPPDLSFPAARVRAFLDSQLERYSLEALFDDEPRSAR